jgi:hypothetical protein
MSELGQKRTSVWSVDQVQMKEAPAFTRASLTVAKTGYFFFARFFAFFAFFAMTSSMLVLANQEFIDLTGVIPRPNQLSTAN